MLLIPMFKVNLKFVDDITIRTSGKLISQSIHAKLATYLLRRVWVEAAQNDP